MSNDNNNQLEKNNKEEEFSIFIEDKENANIKNENKKNKTEYNIEPLNDKSKRNVFIIICLGKNDYNNIKFSFSSWNDAIVKSRILYVSNQYTFDKYSSELFLIQIELCGSMDVLYITITENKKKINKTIFIKDIDNYFFFDNLFETNEILYKTSTDIKFTEFYDYFFDKKSNYEEKFKKDLMSSLIRYESEILLDGNNILKIFKFCTKYELNMNKMIKYIKLLVKKNLYIEQENILLYSEIDNFLSNSNAIKIISHIYIMQLKEKEILNEIINKTKYKKEFSKAILSLLKDKIIEPKDLFFFQKFNLEKIQSFFLEQISSKKEINHIIGISQKLEKALEFIATNYTELYKKIKALSSIFDKNFQIDLTNLEIGDNLSFILNLLKEIITISNSNSFHLINYEILFKHLDDYFYEKDIDTYYQLNEYISLTEKYLNKQIIKEFNDKIHKKGMEMIKSNQMKVGKIFFFMTKMDKYYYSSTFKKSEKREPEIMKYIPLTDIDPDYLKNIELMKNYEIINCFLGSKMENEFYSVILDQVNKIIDLKFIFEIFPLKQINEKFISLINEKIKKIKYSNISYI